MTGIIVLILRIILIILLYGFLGWSIYSIWKDLRIKSHLYSPERIPLIKLALDNDHEFEFHQSIVNIGRDPACELELENETVSGYHARVSYHHNQWWLEDLNSTNGTYLNLEALSTPTVIINNDEFQCGSVSIKVIL